MLSFNTFISILLLLIQYVLSFNINSQNNIAVYWGQNSRGNQKRLSEYCQSSNANIFILSFLNVFPDSIGLNFANACTDTFTNDPSLLHCSEIASDIETCQSLGKKVLLSLGGASGSYGFTTDEEAENFAQTLWNTFGEGSDSTSVDRPFNSALIDGFDFDIENGNPLGYSALVNKLRNLFEQGSKEYYISAAPQCPYPDASVGQLLANSKVDFAFIQFYNNYCNVDKEFNWKEWENYATNVSPNPDIKLFLGLPGSPTAANSGFISNLDSLKETIDSIKKYENFGGISIWDASQGYSYEIDGENYIENIENLLNDSTFSTSSSTTSSSSSTSIPTSFSDVRVTSTLSPATTSSTSISSSPLYNRITSTLSPISISSFHSASSNNDVTSQSIVTPTSTIEQVSSFSAVSNEYDSISVSTPPPVSIASFQTKDIFTNTKITTASTYVSNTFSTSILTPTVTVDESTSTLIPTTNTIATDKPASTETSSIEHITSTLYPKTTSLSTNTATATSISSNTAHEQAQTLNQLYSEGKFNGESKCTDGAVACSSDGELAICNFGSWTTVGCASGTICYAYDQGGHVFTQCGSADLKQNFV